jgi:4-hydroxy-3-polyprenylbenzoate decarboxylase
MAMNRRRIIVGISGATGFQYGLKALELLSALQVETHLVVSKAAELTRSYETDVTADRLSALADVTYPIADVGAAIASGSFQTLGMLVAPCSMRTLAVIASGASDNLLTRAADVILKERRRLVLMARETPLHLGHLRNMVTVTEIGGVIFPPVPAFYQKPATLDDLVTHSVARALDLFGLDVKTLPRWGAAHAVRDIDAMTTPNGSLTEGMK